MRMNTQAHCKLVNILVSSKLLGLLGLLKNKLRYQTGWMHFTCVVVILSIIFLTITCIPAKLNV